MSLPSRSHAFSGEEKAWRIASERLVPCAGILARPIRLQDFSTSRKIAPAFWSWCARGEAPCYPGDKALHDWRTKPFPAAATFSSAPSGRISSRCLRLPLRSPSCQSQRSQRLGRGSPGQRHSLKPSSGLYLITQTLATG